MLQLLITFLYLIFALSAIVLIVVILLQEGKGGGLGQALGGHAQTTFGVGAKGINQFTGYCAGVFLGSAVLIHVCQERLEGRSSMEFADQPGLSEPIEGGAAGGATNTTSEER